MRRRPPSARLGPMDGYLVIANAHAGSVEQEALDGAVGVLSTAGPTQVHTSSDPDDLEAALTRLNGLTSTQAPAADGGKRLEWQVQGGPE